MEQVHPDIEWQRENSERKGIALHCQFANADQCPRFYQSISLLGESGITTKIEEKKDKNLLEYWERTRFWPTITEYATSISGPNDESRNFSNFCPEVSYKVFGLFADSLSRYADEIDKGIAERNLINSRTKPANDWRWNWAYVSPMHYAECPLYSQLIEAKQRIPRNLHADKLWDYPIIKYKGLSFMQKISFWGSVASIVGLLLYFVPYQVQSENISTNNATTSGNQSPAIGENKGTVNINYSSPQVQTVKKYIISKSSGAVTILSEVDVSAIMDKSKHVCTVIAGTSVTLLNEEKELNGAKFQKIQVTEGSCANGIGWVYASKLSYE